MKKYLKFLFILAFSIIAFGCSSQEIPQAHKGRMFDKTGGLALWSGGKGFNGPILTSGTYYTGVYDELQMVECAQLVKKEPLSTLTKDGIQFVLEIYIQYSVNCNDDKVVEKILDSMSPGWPDDPAHKEWKFVIFGIQLYDAYIRPALGEAVRRSVSTYIANDINPNRDKIFDSFKNLFDEQITKLSPKLIVIHKFSLSNMDFPDQLDNANLARAEQAILKDKAVAELDKIKSQIETAKGNKELSEANADVDAIRIDKVGAALRRNPEYVQLETFKAVGEKGNLVVLPSNQPIILNRK